MLIAIGVMGLCFVVATGAVAFLVVRGVRRRYRALRARLLGAPAARPDLETLLRRSGSLAAASIGSSPTPMSWRALARAGT